MRIVILVVATSFSLLFDLPNDGEAITKPIARPLMICLFIALTSAKSRCEGENGPEPKVPPCRRHHDSITIASRKLSSIYPMTYRQLRPFEPKLRFPKSRRAPKPFQACETEVGW